MKQTNEQQNIPTTKATKAGLTHWNQLFSLSTINIYQGIYLDNMVISWKRSLFKFKPIFFLDRAFFSYYKSVVH